MDRDQGGNLSVDDVAQDFNVRDTLVRANSDNLVLQRLQSRVRGQAHTGEVITSYDRMHHRHSRT